MSQEQHPNFKKYLNKNLLAVDYGTKVTGLASFCPGRDPFPTPYGRIIYKNNEQLCSELIEIIEEECIDSIILGLPLFTDGKETEMSKKVRSFAKLLCKKSGLEVILHDEHLSTYEAENRMKQDPNYNFKVDPKKIDAVAASIILEDFIGSES